MSVGLGWGSQSCKMYNTGDVKFLQLHLIHQHIPPNRCSDAAREEWKGEGCYCFKGWAISVRMWLVGISMSHEDIVIIFWSQIHETPDFQEEEKKNEY